MKKTLLPLKVCYYGIIVVAVALTAIILYLIKNVEFQPIERNQTLGLVIQYITIGYLILSVPLSLYWFKKQLPKIREIADEDMKMKVYKRNSYIRIIAIGLGLLFGLVAYCLLGGYNSMLWCAAISAISLVFCKPTEQRLRLELNPEPTNSDETH